MTQATHNVFLAHNSLDKPEVTKIFIELQKRKLNPWFDKNEIRPGQTFQDQIQIGISFAKSAVILIGSKGLGKWQTWELRALISQCVSRGIPVIPVFLQGCDVNEMPENLLFLKEFQWVQFPIDDDTKEAFDSLEWGITGIKPASDLGKKDRPGKIPKKEDSEKLVEQEIAEKRGNLYLESLIKLKKMIDNLSKEIRESNFDLFNEKPIFLPNEKDNKLLIESILDKIKEKLLEKESLNEIKNKLSQKGKFKTRQFTNDEEIIACYLIELLKCKKKEGKLLDNFAAGNILNLLLKLNLEKDFSYFDLSNISIWEADLRKAILVGVDFNNSDLKNSIFSKPLGCIHSIAFNADGHYFATGDAHGSIRVHNTESLELCYFQNERGSQIWSVAFSSGAEPQRFAWGAEDGSVRLFEIKTDDLGKLKLSNIDFPNEQGSVLSNGRVLSVAFSPSGNILAFGGDGKGDAIKLFDIEKKKLRSLSASNVSCMTFINEKTLACGSNDGHIHIWNLNSDRKSISSEVHKAAIRCIAYNNKQNKIASGGEDGQVILSNYLNLDNDRKTLDFENESTISQVRTLAFSQNENILAVGCIDKNPKGQSEHKIRLWKLTGEEWNFIDNLEGHEHLIRSVAFCPNPTNEPKLLISGGDGRTVKLWHLENENDKWKCKQTLIGYANRVWSVAFSKEKDKDSKDCITFACGGEDNNIHIWNYHDRTDIPIHNLSEHTDWVWSITFNKDGTFIASGGEDNKIFLWELQDEKWESIELTEQVNKDNALTGQGNNELTEEGNNKLTGHSKRVRCVVFHPDSNILASAGNDNKVVLWNLDNKKSPQILKEFLEHKDRVLSLAFSAKGDYLASSGRETKIYLRKKEEGNSYKTVKGNSDHEKDHTDQVHSIAFSPYDKTSSTNTLVSGGFDTQLKLWDVNSEELIHKLTWSGEQKILSVAFHPTEQIIASAGHGCFITLWDISDAHKPWPKKILKGHKLAVESVVFSPDGKRLISCSQDQTIKFWDVEGDINISINTIELGKLYQGMNISGIKGLDEAQMDALEELGASRDRKISGVSN